MKMPYITLSITGVMLTLFVLMGGAPEPLTWFANTDQSVWRLLTAHFVHSDLEHLLWNTGAFLLLGGIIEQYSRRDLLIALAVGVLAINCYLLTLYSLAAYIGLSGVLNTLLIVALFRLSSDSEYRDAAIWTLLLSMAKIVYELYTEHSVFSSISWIAVPEAHLVGWLAGVLLVTVQTVNYFSKNKFKRYKQVVNV